MKICIISDYCYPLKNDPTGKIAYLMAKSFLKKGHDVVVYTHSFSFRQKKYKKIDNLNFVISKSPQEKKYSFSELQFIYKNPLLLVFAIIKLFLLKVFSKLNMTNVIKKDVFFDGHVASKISYLFDVAIYVCGNFQICQLLVGNKIKSKVNILYAIDYWKSDFDYVVHSYFDCVYGQQSYEEKETNFKGKYKICTPLVDFSQFCDRKIKKIKNDVVKVRYFGNLYGPRDYTSFLNVLNSIKDDGVSIEVYSNLYKQKSKYKNLVFRKQIYGAKYINAFYNSNILLVLDNDIKFQKWVPSKLYECMASNKPIIIFVSNKNSFIKKETEMYKNKIIVHFEDFDNIFYEQLVYFIKNRSLNIVFDFKKAFPLSIPDIFSDDVIALIKKENL